MARIVTDTMDLAKETGAGPTYSTAQLVLTVHSDGQVQFTGADGIVYRTSDTWAKKLFAAVDALT